MHRTLEIFCLTETINNSGVLADNSTSRFGRRRPYMMLGTAICMSAMLLLGFTRAVASIFTGWDNDSVRLLVNHTPFISHCNIMCSARMTHSRFGLLFSLFISSTSPSMQVICHTRDLARALLKLHSVQAVDRALLVDTLPSSSQAAGNAWAARMLGVGSVVGFFV